MSTASMVAPMMVIWTVSEKYPGVPGTVYPRTLITYCPASGSSRSTASVAVAPAEYQYGSVVCACPSMFSS